MSHFFAYLSRLKLIQRWGLMSSARVENVQEHSLAVAQIAHTLAVIRNVHFGGQVQPERVTTLALFHDASEVITGDLPAPIKYFNPRIAHAYKELEAVANERLLAMMPLALQESYRTILLADHADDTDHWALVKAADKIAAYLKCVEELNTGNQEFAKAQAALAESIAALARPEVTYFMTTFVPSCSLSLDELEHIAPT
ncbi:MAG: 5'-deoxynucleotidase, partial [Caldilineaceae bacterium]|nr:5'-deoxynucleotidase [Caldilineaceae bacterium]